MRRKRAESARIHIPPVVNPDRREACLADWKLFLTTYFPRQYFRPFEAIHEHMAEAIIERAKHGGRKAIAAPRGVGKTETVKGMVPYCICKGWVRFPVVVECSTTMAGRTYNDFRSKIAHNDLLAEDFPEICIPVRALEGAPQRAARQHVDGKLTQIVWTANDYLRIAAVDGSIYSGVKYTYAGLDAAIRGLSLDGDRPDMLILNDPETRDSARSEPQIETRRDMIDKDLEGLGDGETPLTMVMLTTLQNTYCLSAEFTDRTMRPAWEGVRYGMFISWPDCYEPMIEKDGDDPWNEYIALRRIDQENGDPYGMTAVDFYLANREKMDAGAKMLVEHFKPQFHESGKQLTYSSIQVQFNRIADTNIEAYLTEYMNQPVEEDEAEKVHLTQGRVLLQTTNLERGEVPQDIADITMGMDIGKMLHHWVKIAWDDDATGTIVDYGVVETLGLSKYSSERAIETAVKDSLLMFSDSDVLNQDEPTLVLCDSGYATDAIYDACLEIGPSWRPARGEALTKFSMPAPTVKKIARYWEAYAKKGKDHAGRPIWIYHINVEYWKNWVQERFLVDVYQDGTRVPGSMALFQSPTGDKRFHRSFGRHMVSEGLEYVPQEGKPNKPTWVTRDPRNNHWLDAIGYAAAAAGCVGIRAIKLPEPLPPPKKEEVDVNPDKKPFVSRRPKRA